MFNHLVRISDEHRITIVRVFPDGREDLGTYVEMPKGMDINGDAFSKFARVLGENLILDSPNGRKALDGR